MTETIAPIVNDLNRPFWDAAGRGELSLPWCKNTGRFFWPPATVSPYALGGAVAWREAGPSGVLKAVAVYRRAFQKAFEPLLPYGVGLVALDIGPRLTGHLPTPEGADVLRTGDRVRLVFRPLIPGGPAAAVIERLAP